MAVTRELFEEQVFFNTVLIENITDSEFGTGFLLIKRFGNVAKQLLFSNKHVFWGKKDKDNPKASKDIHLTFHVKNENEDYILGNIGKIALSITRTEDGYYEHPDKNIDVACINISDAYTKIKIENRSIEYNDFFNFDPNDLYVGQKVIFVGYPKGFFDKKNFLPIARFGTIASIPSIDFNGEKQILLDAQVYPGSSGSPVFFQLQDGKYKLLGIVSAAPISQLEYAELADSTQKTIPVQFIGLGMIFKLETIKQVFEQVTV